MERKDAVEEAPDAGAPGSDGTLVRYDGPAHLGPSKSSPYPISRLAPPHDLVDLARQIQEADSFLSVKVSAELGIIAEQMQALRARAEKALEAAKINAELHRISCTFKKRPGKTYHLYRRPNGDRYWSMLSPDEWGASCPHTFEGTYRLENDMSFVRVENS